MLEINFSKEQPQPMNMVVLPEREWLNLSQKLDEISSLVVNRNAGELNSEWVESTVARKMLGVSKSTWQTYRDQRRIPFSQFGRKIYVKRADLNAFMHEHYIEPVND